MVCVVPEWKIQFQPSPSLALCPAVGRIYARLSKKHRRIYSEPFAFTISSGRIWFANKILPSLPYCASNIASLHSITLHTTLHTSLPKRHQYWHTTLLFDIKLIQFHKSTPASHSYAYKSVPKSEKRDLCLGNLIVFNRMPLSRIQADTITSDLSAPESRQGFKSFPRMHWGHIQIYQTVAYSMVYKVYVDVIILSNYRR